MYCKPPLLCGRLPIAPLDMLRTEDGLSASVSRLGQGCGWRSARCRPHGGYGKGKVVAAEAEPSAWKPNRFSDLICWLSARTAVPCRWWRRLGWMPRRRLKQSFKEPTVLSLMLMSPWLMPCPLAISVPSPVGEPSPLGLLTCRRRSVSRLRYNACTLPCGAFTDDGEVAVESAMRLRLVDIVRQHQCLLSNPLDRMSSFAGDLQTACLLSFCALKRR